MPQTMQTSPTIKKPPERIFRAICNRQWVMDQADLDVFIKIAQREDQFNPQAVTALLGNRLDNTDEVTVRDGVAVIPVIGPIMRYSSLFTRISGASGIDSLALDFNTALASRNVKAILFEIDSPGGEVAGVSEFADMIYSARADYPDKPIWAYVSDQGASGAYWIASAAERIVISPTSILGSIGVVCVMRGNDPKSKEVEFVSSQSPNKRPNIATQEGRDQIQNLVDSLASVFVSQVARNRGVSEETVINDFGHGGIKVGSDAVQVGLADALGTFEQCIAQLSGKVAVSEQPIRPSRRAASLAAAYNVGLSLGEGMGTLADRYNRLKAAVAHFDNNDNEAEEIESVDTPEDVQPVTASADNTSSDSTPAQTINTSAHTDRGVDMDELARLRAENARLKAERWNAEAATFFANALTDARVFPTEREAIIAAYIRSAQDDATLAGNDGVSRVKLLENMIAARPKHQLTAESLVPKLANMLSNTSGPAPTNANEDVEPSDADIERLLGMTDVGKQVLAEMNGR